MKEFKDMNFEERKAEMARRLAQAATERVTQHLGAGVDGVQTSTPSERFITAIFGAPESAADKAARIAAMDSFQRARYEREEKARLRRNR